MSALEVARASTGSPHSFAVRTILYQNCHPKGQSPCYEYYSNHLKITDRHEAIKTAVMLAEPRDIILLAGKGHEDYQIIGTEKYPFNDKAVIKEWFEKFGR